MRRAFACLDSLLIAFSGSGFPRLGVAASLNYFVPFVFTGVPSVFCI
jgi:hypothetical protein